MTGVVLIYSMLPGRSYAGTSKPGGMDIFHNTHFQGFQLGTYDKIPDLSNGSVDGAVCGNRRQGGIKNKWGLLLKSNPRPELYPLPVRKRKSWGAFYTAKRFRCWPVLSDTWFSFVQIIDFFTKVQAKFQPSVVSEHDFSI